MKDVINKYFRKIGDGELIELGDFSSLDEGKTLRPIFNENTIGDIPANFSADRSFWRLFQHDATSHEAESQRLYDLYNEAYYRFVHCPEKEKKEAKERLDILRSKFFNY